MRGEHFQPRRRLRVLTVTVATVFGSGVLAAGVTLSDRDGTNGDRVTLTAAGTATVPVSSTIPTAASDTGATEPPNAGVPTPPPPPPTTAAPTTAPPPPAARHVVEQDHVPFAIARGVTLVHPARLVERVGFHQSNHEGAQTMEAVPSAVLPTVLEARDRLTSGATAADIVVDPSTPIVSPVSGVVKRAGSYTLYCKYRDDFVVIEPDGQPGLELKVLHIDGEQVTPGQRVEAGRTMLAPRATPLPFVSQVDEIRTADPAWPHVHVELVDTSIPNVTSPGGGGSC